MAPQLDIEIERRRGGVLEWDCGLLFVVLPKRLGF